MKSVKSEELRYDFRHDFQDTLFFAFCFVAKLLLWILYCSSSSVFVHNRRNNANIIESELESGRCAQCTVHRCVNDINAKNIMNNNKNASAIHKFQLSTFNDVFLPTIH